MNTKILMCALSLFVGLPVWSDAGGRPATDDGSEASALRQLEREANADLPGEPFLEAAERARVRLEEARAAHREGVESSMGDLLDMRRWKRLSKRIQKCPLPPESDPDDDRVVARGLLRKHSLRVHEWAGEATELVFTYSEKFPGKRVDDAGKAYRVTTRRFWISFDSADIPLLDGKGPGEIGNSGYLWKQYDSHTFDLRYKVYLKDRDMWPVVRQELEFWLGQEDVCSGLKKA